LVIVLLADETMSTGMSLRWLLVCRDAVGRFPDYPSEEEGGSLMIFKEKDPSEVEAALKAMVSYLLTYLFNYLIT